MPVLAVGTKLSKVAAKLGVTKANVFRAPGKFELEGKSIPTAGSGEADVKVRLTTVCGKNNVSEVAVRGA